MNTEIGTYRQPHEGIIGTQRTDDPIFVAYDLIGGLVDKLYRATLVNTTAVAITELRQRITHPRVGDRVVVWDSVGRDPDTRQKGVGYLVEHRAEWWTTDEQWEQDKAEDGTLTEADRMVERDAWYVQYGPNAVDICRWVNCDVFAIPPLMGDR